MSTTPTDVLVLCTANICRSPMAAALLAEHLADRGIAAHVHSAGRMRGGKPMTAEGLAVMRRLGLDLSGHRSERVTSRMVQDADLVVGMAREHVLHAIGLAPDVLPRAFTLKDLVRRGESLGGCAPGEPLGAWLASLNASRGHDELLGSSADDDIADPIGRPLAVYEAVADEIDDLSERLVALGWRQALV